MQLGRFKLASIAFASALMGTLLALWLWQTLTEHRAAIEMDAANDLSEARRKSPIGRQEEAIKRYLNDPNSAMFRSERHSKVSKEFWCGEVNAKNRMGGMVGYVRYVVELHDDPDLADLDSPKVENSNRASTSDNYDFNLYWSGYCQ